MTEEGRLEEPLLDAKRLLVREAIGLLLLAAKILARPQRFSRRAYALDGRGRSVRVDDPRAARFCLAGALLQAEHRRFGTAIPIETSNDDAVDDLLRPVMPEQAPYRLRLAFDALAWSALRELEQFGHSFSEVDVDLEPEELAQTPSFLHAPLLLGLDRRGSQRCARQVLAVSALVLSRVGSDRVRLDQLIADEQISEASV